LRLPSEDRGKGLADVGMDPAHKAHGIQSLQPAAQLDYWQYAPLLVHNRCYECTLPVPIKRGNVSQSKASEKVLLLLSLIKMTYKRAKPITTFAISAEMFDHSSAR
jgi:hypothetical protein